MSTNSLRRSEYLRSLWPWLPLWTVVALLAIFSHGPMPLYSTRTLAVAWEMWREHHFLVPYINGEPYSEKVPLLYWLIHAGWYVFGVSDIWPRVLEVIFGGVQLVLLSVLARRLFPMRPWVAKAAPWMLLALSYAFLFGLQIMYEVLLADCVLGALLCLTPKANRAEPRWLLFGLLIGAGLLTKGPVMLLHIAFPWLLGPFWNDWAREHRTRWYGRGVLAVLLGLAILLAWAIPAGFSGGDAYRHRLFFTQTAARVVDGVQHDEPLQNHAHPFWWYVPYLLVLAFPFSGWPRAWVALGTLRKPFDTGLRFALCWLVPVFVLFSVISGKQLYYLLPEYGGGMLLLAGAMAVMRERRVPLAENYWLGSWPLGMGGILFAICLFAMPNLVAHHYLHGEWFEGAAPYSRTFSVAFLLLGCLLLLRGRGEMRRVAVAGLLGVLALNTLFTLTLWHKYDLSPTTALIASAQSGKRAIGIDGSYEGQYHFAGRLSEAIIELHDGKALQDFARSHPDGLIITHPDTLDAAAQRYALMAQPFRSAWVVVWSAPTLADLRAGRTPMEPAQPPQIFPGAKVQYGAQP
ncbi:ArnT family glycosyltransferase [Dyella psychrodurans]|uniref:Glycosyl transferase n=1 Tax=Dyella psychrodurans TaxID=1927960 RepID=A0A370X6Z0_9GAMM|nr:glycosyltransferase family 39 protein [Dyella psychrodurans]RDS84126.1 glycosyl transferase [Dyella psychrodurans]